MSFLRDVLKNILSCSRGGQISSETSLLQEKENLKDGSLIIKLFNKGSINWDGLERLPTMILKNQNKHALALIFTILSVYLYAEIYATHLSLGSSL